MGREPRPKSPKQATRRMSPRNTSCAWPRGGRGQALTQASHPESGPLLGEGTGLQFLLEDTNGRSPMKSPISPLQCKSNYQTHLRANIFHGFNCKWQIHNAGKIGLPWAVREAPSPPRRHAAN